MYLGATLWHFKLPRMCTMHQCEHVQRGGIIVVPHSLVLAPPSARPGAALKHHATLRQPRSIYNVNVMSSLSGAL